MSVSQKRCPGEPEPSPSDAQLSPVDDFGTNCGYHLGDCEVRRLIPFGNQPPVQPSMFFGHPGVV